MEDKPAMTKHFFKVMMPGFEDKLNLPPAFSTRLKEEKSEEAILKSRKGTWKIKVSRNREGVIRFEDGWPQFVFNHGLSIGDFVVFEHTGGLCFNACIFDRTACEKDFLVESKKLEHYAKPHFPPKNTKRERDKEVVTSYHSQKPHFILTMAPYHAQKKALVTIPVDFVRSVKLQNKSCVTLRDLRRRTWPVKLSVQTSAQLRIRMQSGWHDFYVSNDLKDGDVCHFELNRQSLQCTTVLIDVKIFPAPRR